MAKEKVEGTRKSARARHAPEVFMPVTSGRKSAKSTGTEALSPEDETDSRLGEEFQAELPQMQLRPPVPTAEEVCWLEGLVLEVGSTVPPSYPEAELAAMAEAAPLERAAWVEKARLDLLAVLGSKVASLLGLDTMGTAYIGTLSADEETLLHAGLKEHGREFHAVRLEFVPTRTVHELINHYYNVWKLKATPQARHWHLEREQVGLWCGLLLMCPGRRSTNAQRPAAGCLPANRRSWPTSRSWRSRSARQRWSGSAGLTGSARRMSAACCGRCWAGSSRQRAIPRRSTGTSEFWMPLGPKCTGNQVFFCTGYCRPALRERGLRTAKLVGAMNAKPQPAT